MAKFGEALPIILTHEGGYVNRHEDLGGETYEGIARKFHPDWEGWPFIDAALCEGESLNDIQELPGLVESFYQGEFWDHIKGDAIENQDVANLIIDCGVVCGTGTAVKLMQKAAGVSADGAMGPHSIAAINEQEADGLIATFRVDWADYFRGIVERHPDQHVFLAGWLNRARG